MKNSYDSTYFQHQTKHHSIFSNMRWYYLIFFQLSATYYYFFLITLYLIYKYYDLWIISQYLNIMNLIHCIQNHFVHIK